MKLGKIDRQPQHTSKEMPVDHSAEYAKAFVQLKYYLEHGEIESGFLEGRAFISAPKLQVLLIRAGYTEYALAFLRSGGYSLVDENDRNNQLPESKIMITVNGIRHDGIELTKELLENEEPDLRTGTNILRAKILTNLQALEEIRQKALNNFFFPATLFFLGTWNMKIGGSMRFLLNPTGNRDHAHGWYSLEELRKWADQDPESPTLEKNQVVAAKDESKPEKSYPQQYEDELNKLVILRSSAQNEMQHDMYQYYSQLLRIAVWRCPFPEIVEKFSFI